MGEALPSAGEIAVPQQREGDADCTRCQELEGQIEAITAALETFYSAGVADGNDQSRRNLGLPCRNEAAGRRSRPINTVVILAALVILTTRLVTAAALPALHPHGRRPAAAVSASLSADAYSNLSILRG